MTETKLVVFMCACGCSVEKNVACWVRMGVFQCPKCGNWFGYQLADSKEKGG